MLPVQNLTFMVKPGKPAKALFTFAEPVGWTGGTGLISIDAPGTATQTGGPGNAYPVYALSLSSPVETLILANGHPTCENSFPPSP